MSVNRKEEVNIDKSQLMKGTLEGCILKIIERSETYGYEIVDRLQKNGFKNVKEGTLYPLLLRLEKKKLITATYRPSQMGPSRKYYALTGEGKSYVETFYRNWLEVCESVQKNFEEESI